MDRLLEPLALTTMRQLACISLRTLVDTSPSTIERSLINLLLHPLLPPQMMTRHDAVRIALPALLAARVACRAVTADLAAAAVQARGLFGQLVGW